jgi:hypothetical protein
MLSHAHHKDDDDPLGYSLIESYTQYYYMSKIDNISNKDIAIIPFGDSVNPMLVTLTLAWPIHHYCTNWMRTLHSHATIMR